MAKEKKSQSPYVKYNKTPYRYSETYYQWREASRRGERDKAANLARKHTGQFMRPNSFWTAEEEE